MFRKLATPLALENDPGSDNRILRTLRISNDDPDDARVLLTLAANRMMIKKLERDLEDDRMVFDLESLSEELDMIKTSIRVGLLEVSNELDEIPSSEQIFEEAIA